MLSYCSSLQEINIDLKENNIINNIIDYNNEVNLNNINSEITVIPLAIRTEQINFFGKIFNIPDSRDPD